MRIKSLASLAGALIIGSMAAAQFPGMKIVPRYFNDCPTTTLNITNNYPSSVAYEETGMNTAWANRHLAYFSSDGGATPMVFNHGDEWEISMDVTFNPSTGAPRQEAGFLFMYNGWDGQMMVASDGEVAVFGYILPFHTWGNIYTPGTTIRIGIKYFYDPADAKYKFKYWAGDQYVIKTPDNLEQGLLDGTWLGTYVQHHSTGAETVDNNTVLSHIVAGYSNAKFAMDKIVERYFNDNSDSILTTTNDFSNSVIFDESNLHVNLNRHIWWYSTDGTNPSTFNNNEDWNFEVDVKIEPTPANTPRQEAGIYFMYNGWDGQMMVASDGEVAVFGYILPFKTFGNIYTAGTWLTIGVRYFTDPVDSLHKFEYYAGNNREILIPTNLEQGIIDGTWLGCYAQHQGHEDAVRAVKTSFNHPTAVKAGEAGPILKGTAYLEFFTGSTTGMPATLELRDPNTTNVLHSYPITLSGMSTYQVSGVATGTFDVAVKFPHFLRRVAEDVVIGAGTTTVDFSPNNGDADETNGVDLFDLNAVLVSFGTLDDPNANFDGTGNVDLLDMNVALLNFALVGDN